MPVTGSNHINYNLSIRITADGFSFFVTEALSGDLMHREDFPIRTEEPLSTMLAKALIRPSIQRTTYSKVRVVIDSDSTCIPLDEFRREDLPSHYKLVFDNVDIEKQNICYTLLPQIEVVEAFSVPKEVCNTISEIYPEATYTNSYATVMGRTAQFCKHRNPSMRPLFAYVQRNQLFIYSIFQEKLLYANNFVIEHDQNALYYLLSVWKELELDECSNTCFIGGDPEPAKQLAEEARQYLLHVDQMDTVDLAHL